LVTDLFGIATHQPPTHINPSLKIVIKTNKKAFLDNMDHDYQLVLCSATINAAVRCFARDTMEIEKGSPSFVTVGIAPIKSFDGSASVFSSGVNAGSNQNGVGGGVGGAAAALLAARASDGLGSSSSSSSLLSSGGGGLSDGAPVVRHWRTAARFSARAGVAADLVATLQPRTAIVFVATKVECDAVAEEFGTLLAGAKVAGTSSRLSCLPFT
jgi:hypothetical protein